MAIVTRIVEMLNNDIYEYVSNGDAEICIPRHYDSKKLNGKGTDYFMNNGLYINASLNRIYDPLFDGTNAYQVYNASVHENYDASINLKNSRKYLLEDLNIKPTDPSTPLGMILSSKPKIKFASIKNIRRGNINTITVFSNKDVMLKMEDGSLVGFREMNNKMAHIEDEFWR